MKISFLSKTVESGDFLAKTAVVAAVTALTVGGAVVLWRLSDLLPAVFATILLALGTRSRSISPRRSP